VIKLYYGNEPYYLSAEKDKILKEKGIDAGIFYSWEEAKEIVFVPPLLSDRRIVVLELEKLTADESLSAYLQKPSEFTDLFIFAGSVERNTKIYKLIKKDHAQMQCDKLSEPLLKKWIGKQLSNYGAAMNQDAYDTFMRRIPYYDDPDCNLYSIKNWICQLAFYHSEITEEVIKEVVLETLNEKMFALSKYLLAKNYPSAFRLTQLLLESREQPIAMLSAMLRTFRLSYKASLFPEVKGKALDAMLGAAQYQYAAAMRYPMPVLQKCIREIQISVNDIKSGKPAQAIFVTTLGTLCETIETGSIDAGGDR